MNLFFAIKRIFALFNGLSTLGASASSVAAGKTKLGLLA
jgi:hypothetical protein